VSATESVTQAVGALTRTVTEVLPETIFDLQGQIEERMRRIPTRLNEGGHHLWTTSTRIVGAQSLMTNYSTLLRYWTDVSGSNRYRMSCSPASAQAPF